MQVVRNKGGYVILVTNVEWALLQDFESAGRMTYLEELEGGYSGLERAEKSILTQIENNNRPWMQVTEDRRK